MPESVQALATSITLIIMVLIDKSCVCGLQHLHINVGNCIRLLYVCVCRYQQ